MNTRHRPLHACGVSMLTIADLAYNRIASPLIYAMQYRWLAVLSFIDDHILAVEKMIEKLFPPSAYAFDKIDQLVQMIESVPEKLDDAVNRFPAIIHRIPPIEWALAQLVSWLNCLISTPIDVDMKGNEGQGSASEALDYVEAENKGAVMPFESRHDKGTYKEVLERGQAEKSQKQCK